MALISLQAAAARTSTSVWTWRRWASDRRIQTIKLGRRRLVDEAVLDQLIQSGTLAADPTYRRAKSASKADAPDTSVAVTGKGDASALPDDQRPEKR
jgi:excisionase family DNA binding protein